jgi:predicted protein tyrosine phosphatase
MTTDCESEAVAWPGSALLTNPPTSVPTGGAQLNAASDLSARAPAADDGTASPMFTPTRIDRVNVDDDALIPVVPPPGDADDDMARAAAVRSPTTAAFVSGGTYGSSVAPVIPGELYLCGQRDLAHVAVVRRLRITAFVCVTQELERPSYVAEHDVTDGRAALLHLPMADNGDRTKLADHLARAFDFIDAARADGRAVVVYCQAGKSRSVSVVAAYMMREFDIGFRAAMDHIRLTRPIVDPNIAFCMQLLSLEGSPLLVKHGGGRKTRHGRSLSRSASRSQLCLEGSGCATDGNFAAVLAPAYEWMYCVVPPSYMAGAGEADAAALPPVEGARGRAVSMQELGAQSLDCYAGDFAASHTFQLGGLSGTAFPSMGQGGGMFNRSPPSIVAGASQCDE